MDKFNGIKRADGILKRNDYKKTDYRPKILWRYIFAAFLVLGVMFFANFTDYEITELFRQDYFEQYAGA